MPQKVKVYTTGYCPYCVEAKRLLTKLGVPFEEIGLDGKDDLRSQISQENGGWRTVPMVFVGSHFVGGFSELQKLHQQNKLMPMIDQT